MIEKKRWEEKCFNAFPLCRKSFALTRYPRHFAFVRKMFAFSHKFSLFFAPPRNFTFSCKTSVVPWETVHLSANFCIPQRNYGFARKTLVFPQDTSPNKHCARKTFLFHRKSSVFSHKTFVFPWKSLHLLAKLLQFFEKLRSLTKCCDGNHLIQEFHKEHNTFATGYVVQISIKSLKYNFSSHLIFYSHHHFYLRVLL